ncbi:MAG: hypothetical protein R3E78_04960 [Burkholderiaceae bacterium]
MSLHLSLRQPRRLPRGHTARVGVRRRAGAHTAASLRSARCSPAWSAGSAFGLFVRHGNRLVPKPEAHFFLEEVGRVLDSFGRAVDMMGAVARLHAGPLRIACMPAASLFLVPRLVSEFVRDRPGVQVTLMSNSSVAVRLGRVAAVRRRHRRAARRARVMTIDAIETDCVCAHARRDDPLARRRVRPRRTSTGGRWRHCSTSIFHA